jgi:hypothetical protein
MKGSPGEGNRAPVVKREKRSPVRGLLQEETFEAIKIPIDQSICRRGCEESTRLSK